VKDNKIDIMQSKCGDMYMVLNGMNLSSVKVDDVMKGIRQLQYDLELLRKCTLDNPDFKWDDANKPTDYYDVKRKAMRNE